MSLNSTQQGEGNLCGSWFTLADNTNTEFTITHKNAEKFMEDFHNMLKFVDMAFELAKCILRVPYIPPTKEKGNHVYSLRE